MHRRCDRHVCLCRGMCVNFPLPTFAACIITSYGIIKTPDSQGNFCEVWARVGKKQESSVL